MLWKVFVFTKNLAPMQLGGSYTQWEARKLVLKFGEVFLTSVDSGIFLAYLYFFPHYIKSYNYFLFFLSPLTYLFHFIASCSHKISSVLFVFRLLLPLHFKDKILFLLWFLLLFPTGAVKHCCNIFKTNLGHGLSSFSGKAVKVFIEAVGGRVTIEGLFLSLLRNHLDQQGDSCRKAQNCRMWSLWLPAAFTN